MCGPGFSLKRAGEVCRNRLERLGTQRLLQKEAQCGEKCDVIIALCGIVSAETSSHTRTHAHIHLVPTAAERLQMCACVIRTNTFCKKEREKKEDSPWEGCAEEKL